MPYIKKVKLPNSDTIYNIYDDEAAHMSDEPVFALEDSEDIYADTINADTLQGHVANDFVRVLDTSANTETAPLNADTFGGKTPEEYATQEELNALTAADVGAAPAGYGLGEEFPTFQVNDLNSATSTGTYRYGVGSANAPTNSGEWVHVESYSSTFKHQTAFVSYTGGNVVERWMRNGVWEPWEWRNPPMSVGVEYRTTERWNGKVVYTKLVNYTGMPNSNRYAVAHGAAATQILRCAGMNITTGMNIPCDTISVFADKTNITIITTADHRSHFAYVQIWYTKD